MTNRDKLNGMSNKELANFIHSIMIMCDGCVISDFCVSCKPFNGCENVLYRWLESEVEE